MSDPDSDFKVVETTPDSVVDISTAGIKATQERFKGLPAAAKAQLAKATKQVADNLVTEIQAAARGKGRQAGSLADTVHRSGSRTKVTVIAGGTEPIFKSGTPAFKSLFGSEFGGKHGHGFEWQGKRSAWFYRTADAQRAVIAEEWQTVATAIANSFDSDGKVT